MVIVRAANDGSATAELHIPDTGAAPKPRGGDDAARTADGTEADARSTSAWGTVGEWLTRVASVAAGSISLLGFVALIGAALTWWRYWTLGLPPNQALQAVPADERVITGAGALMVFIVLGLMAVAAVYAIDRPGRPTVPMRQGLGTLVAVEMLVVIWVGSAWAPGTELSVKLWATGVIFIWAAAGWTVTHDASKPRGDGLPEVQGDDPKHRPFYLYVDENSFGERLRRVVGIPFRWTAGFVLAIDAKLSRRWHEHESFWARVATEARKLSLVSKKPVLLPLSPDELSRWRDRVAKPPGSGGPDRPRFDPETWHQPRDFRWVRELTPFGLLTAASAALITLGALVMTTGEWVIAASFGAACLLAALIFGLCASIHAFWPYGIAVFVSVCLFGAFAQAAQQFHLPQGQAAAVTRPAGAGPGLIGLYVAKTNEGLWLAPFAWDERCKPRPRRGSGSVFLVPADQIAHYAVGGLLTYCRARSAAPDLRRQLSGRFPTP